MNLSNEKQEALALLSGNRGFQVLCEVLRDELEATMAAMGNAVTDLELVRLSRLWQAGFRFLQVMQTTPQALAETMAREREEAAKAGTLDPVYDFLMPAHRRQQLADFERNQ